MKHFVNFYSKGLFDCDFEDTPINYVGEDNFNAWFYELPEEERTMTNFKQFFDISDELEKKIKDKPWKEKEDKKE